jgi:replicative DNA helicase
MKPKYDLRNLPQDKAAEAAVIASMIIQPACVPHIIEFIEADSFFCEEARVFFEIIKGLWLNKQPIDAVVIRNKLASGQQVECTTYLVNAINSVPSAANALYYAKIVRQKNIERKLICEIEAIGRELAEPNLTLDDKIALVGKLPALYANREPQQTDEIAKLIANHLAELQDTGGLTTGFATLDRMTSGFKNGDLILLAGRPSIGKSSLMLDFYLQAARIGGRPYLYSLEMTSDKIIQRLLKNLSRTGGNLYSVQNDYVKEAARLLSLYPAWIADKADPSVEKIAANILIQKEKRDIGIVFIDYIQLIEAKGKDRYEQITGVSRFIKQVAVKANIPIVALCQLNRKCEERRDHRPYLSDLRDSGSLEQDADLIIFLHRDDYYRLKENPQAEQDGRAQCIIAKNRDGCCGDVEMVWLPECFTFGELNLQSVRQDKQGDLPI